VLTNVSSDHLDLQGIHTLPELAEVKATICRITRPDGLVVLNGDDRFVAAMARRVRAPVAFFSVVPGGSPVVRRHLARGGRAYVLDDGELVELEGGERRGLVRVAEVPITIGGLARHNVANALAAAGAARAMGATLEQVRNGLTDFRPSSERSPGRLNIFRAGSTIAIVDFAHNEAGVNAVLDVADGIAAAGGNGRRAPVTMIIGTAGDRPDDTLRGIGRIAGQRVQRIAVKETIKYLRGRSRESMIGELLAGVRAARFPTSDIPVYETETEALGAELAHGGTPVEGPSGGVARVVVLMCHEEREEVFRLLERMGAKPLDLATDLSELLSNRPA
jgi:cyanophycin synthetase